MKCWEESMVILVKETSPSNFLVNQISKNRRKWLEKVFSERYFTNFFQINFIISRLLRRFGWKKTKNPSPRLKTHIQLIPPFQIVGRFGKSR